MKVDEDVARLVRQIREMGKQIRWLRSRQKELESLPPVSGSCVNGFIDFDNLKHEDTVKVMRNLRGGKWKKDYTGDNRVTYTTVVDGMNIRIWRGEPPPSCRIVEVEELVPERVIPAQVVKVRKLVCQPSLAATIAQAQDKATPQAEVAP